VIRPKGAWETFGKKNRLGPRERIGRRGTAATLEDKGVDGVACKKGESVIAGTISIAEKKSAPEEEEKRGKNNADADSERID